MGGSLAAACRTKFPQARVLGISRTPSVLREAKRKKWIHEGFADLRAGVAQADLVVLSTPVDTLPKMLAEIEKSARPGTLVTDVGSVKGPVARFAEGKRFKHIRFVGAHPMVGSHERGLAAAHGGLYDRGFTLVAKSPKTDAGAFNAVLAFWKKISPKVFVVRPEEHDRIVAEISHLPHAAAVCLALAVSGRSLGFAAGGFADTTRVAQGHASIWLPIILNNRRFLVRSLRSLEKALREFRRAAAKGDSRRLAALLEKARSRRGQISV